MSERACTLAEIEALESGWGHVELIPMDLDDLGGHEIAQFGAILVEVYPYGRDGAPPYGLLSHAEGALDNEDD